MHESRHKAKVGTKVERTKVGTKVDTKAGTTVDTKVGTKVNTKVGRKVPSKVIKQFMMDIECSHEVACYMNVCTKAAWYRGSKMAQRLTQRLG